jgi:hypothetical protein
MVNRVIKPAIDAEPAETTGEYDILEDWEFVDTKTLGQEYRVDVATISEMRALVVPEINDNDWPTDEIVVESNDGTETPE